MKSTTENSPAFFRSRRELAGQIPLCALALRNLEERYQLRANDHKKFVSLESMNGREKSMCTVDMVTEGLIFGKSILFIPLQGPSSSSS